jgi:hypothetical protein
MQRFPGPITLISEARPLQVTGTADLAHRILEERICIRRARLGHEMLKAALTWDIIPSQSGFPLVGVTGFEL